MKHSITENHKSEICINQGIPVYFVCLEVNIFLPFSYHPDVTHKQMFVREEREKVFQICKMCESQEYEKDQINSSKSQPSKVTRDFPSPNFRPATQIINVNL